MSLIEPKPCREMIQVATDSGFSSLAPSHSRYASKVSEESDTRLSMMRSSSVESNVMRSALDYDCMRTSISSGLSRGAMQAHHAKNYRISIKDCTRKDIKFFEAVRLSLSRLILFWKEHSSSNNILNRLTSSQQEEHSIHLILSFLLRNVATVNDSLLSIRVWSTSR